jgi:hypothetical protein
VVWSVRCLSRGALGRHIPELVHAVDENKCVIVNYQLVPISPRSQATTGHTERVQQRGATQWGRCSWSRTRQSAAVHECRRTASHPFRDCTINMEVEGQVDGGNAAVGAGAAVTADSPVHVVSWNVAGWIKTMEYIRKVREGFASARSRVLSALTQSHTLLCRALTRLTLAEAHVIARVARPARHRCALPSRGQGHVLSSRGRLCTVSGRLAGDHLATMILNLCDCGTFHLLVSDANTPTYRALHPHLSIKWVQNHPRVEPALCDDALPLGCVLSCRLPAHLSILPSLFCPSHLSDLSGCILSGLTPEWRGSTPSGRCVMGALRQRVAVPKGSTGWGHWCDVDLVRHPSQPTLLHWDPLSWTQKGGAWSQTTGP